ncbi:MAG: RNA polymerase sigma factor [Deltaproteobacteria bacterium]|nr:RNA polymerase sigma factor [Deltaproteobacteria bacterium]
MSTAELSPDQARALAAAKGDRRAAEALLAQLLPRVRNLVRYLVRGDWDVDDIAQEALIAIFRGLPTYRAEGTFKSWADRVVVRVTLASIRAARTRPSRPGPEPVELTMVPDPSAPADEYLTRREMALMLDEIPFDQRHALVLHHVVGMSVPEIAEQLSTPLETVRSRLRLGMASLRAMHEKTKATKREP